MHPYRSTPPCTPIVACLHTCRITSYNIQNKGFPTLLGRSPDKEAPPARNNVLAKSIHGNSHARHQKRRPIERGSSYARQVKINIIGGCKALRTKYVESTSVFLGAARPPSSLVTALDLPQGGRCVLSLRGNYAAI